MKGYTSTRWTEAELEIVQFGIKHGMGRQDMLKLLPNRSPGAVSDKMLDTRREQGIAAPRGRSIMRKVMAPTVAVDVDPIGGTDESFRSMCRRGSEMLHHAIERYMAKQRFTLSSQSVGIGRPDAAPLTAQVA